MSTQQDEHVVIKRFPPNPKRREQWQWFGFTAIGGLVGSVILLLLNAGATTMFSWTFYPNSYRGVMNMLMYIGIVGAVFAALRRYWLPMVAFFVLGVVVYPLLWRLVYVLIFR